MSITYFSLAGGSFTQDWSDLDLITTNDVWQADLSIIGYLGDIDPGTTSGVDPRTRTTAALGAVDVIANQTNTGITNGGVAEFQIADPTVALQGSGTADAPSLVIYLNAAARQNIVLTFNARDIDGSGDNALQQLAVQYRTSADGVWINIADAYDSDVTTGGTATEVTPFTVVLPAEANDQSLLQIRILTTNAAGNDEWVGIDDIQVTSQALLVLPETLSIAAAAADKAEGDAGTTAFTFTVTRANPAGEAGVAWSLSGLGGPGQADAADFAGATSGTLTFAAGETSKTITVEVAADTLVETDETFAVTLSDPTGGAVLGTASASGTIRNDDVAITLISAIQGTGAVAALVGQVVTVEAVVVGDFQNGDADTRRNLGGVFLQEEDADADANALTSEGIFVFLNAFGPDLSLGDKVRVTGTVQEFFGLTQLGAVTAVRIVAADTPLPSAAVVSLPAAGTTLSQNGTIQPDLEAYEGMLVTVAQTLTVTEQFNLDRFNEIKLVAGDRPFQFTHDNDPSVEGYAAHLQEVGARTITYDDGLNTQNQPISILDGFGPDYTTATAPRMGDTVENLSGVLDYQWAGSNASGATWRIRAVEDGTNEFVSANPRDAAPPEVGGRLTVGSFNVLNFFTTLNDPRDDGSRANPADDTAIGLEPRGANSAAEFARQLEKLATVVQGLDADILGLIEMENDFLEGAPGNAVEFLVEQLNAAGGTYDWVRPPTGQFLGSDAIAVAYIYDTTAVRIAAGTSVQSLDDSDLAALGLGDLLAQSTVGGIFNGANTSRAALAVTWEELGTGETFTSALNHFKSKGGTGTGADADALDGQGNWNQQRLLAAQALDAWLASNPTGAADADRLILGDLNAYFREDPITFLEGQGWQNLQGPENYSYVFDGQRGALDQMLATGSLAAQVTGSADWHINADEADALDYNLDFGRVPGIFDGRIAARVSDHDPLLLGLSLFGRAPEPEDDALAVAEDATLADLVALLLGNDDGNGLTVTAIGTAGTRGTLVFDAATQSLSYIASGFDDLAAGASATDSFTYTVTDAQGDSATATVSVTIAGRAEIATLAVDRAGAALRYSEDGVVLASLGLPQRGGFAETGLPILLSAQGGEVVASPGFGIGIAGTAPGGANPRIEGGERLVIAIGEDAGFEDAFGAWLQVSGARGELRVEAYDDGALVAEALFALSLAGETRVVFDPAGDIAFDELVLSQVATRPPGFTLREVTLALDPDALIG